jgi:tight adherence protein B
VNNPYTIYIISFLAFLAGLGIVQALYLFWRSLNVEEAVKINRRIKAMSAGGAHGKEVLQTIRKKQLSTVPFIDRVLTAIPRFHALDRLIEQSGVHLTLMRFIGIQLGMTLVVFILFTWVSNLHTLLSLAISLVLGLGFPYLFVTKKRIARHRKFTAQLPDALDYLARSMRAGNPFMASLKAASKEIPEPTGEEFGITFDEMNYGLAIEDALYNLSARTGSEEMRFFTTAVLIQKSTGGNLADVLNRIAAVMRARAVTYRDIKILSAEMRYSANVLIALPFFVAGALSITNPTYLTVLFESELGLIIIGLQLLFMLVGYIVIHKMVNFRV